MGGMLWWLVVLTATGTPVQCLTSSAWGPLPEDQEGSGEVTIDSWGKDSYFSLETIVNERVTNYTVGSVIRQTKTALNELSVKGPRDVLNAVSIVEQVSQVAAIPLQAAKDVLDVVDTLSALHLSVLPQAKPEGNISNRLIQSVEDVGRRLDLASKPSVRLVSSATALEVWDLSKISDDSVLPLGLRLKVTGDKEGEDREGGSRLETEGLESIHQHDQTPPSDTEISIALNSSFLAGVRQKSMGEDVRIWMAIFSETSLFQRAEESALNLSDPATGNKSSRRPGARLNSKVISASVSANGRLRSHCSPSVVTAVFLPISEVREEQGGFSRCVFWDMSRMEGRGGWSGEGCRHQRTQDGRDICVCDHLTNFAVLLDFYGQSEQLPKAHRAVLTLMTVVGLSFSICGLFCTVITFICIKKMHKVEPKRVLFNLALAMLLSWVVFLAGFSGAADSQVGCLVAAAVLHYLLLATFLWMLVQAGLQYLLLVRVHGHVRRFLLKASALAWGVPVIPVATILSVDFRLYRGYHDYCWMSLTPFYYGFLLPVSLVLATNLVIYVLVVVSIYRARGRTPCPVMASGRCRQRGVSLRASFACFVILGLSWIFAFLAVAEARPVFQYLFTATTTIQGLLIFLLFIARDPLVQEFWRTKFRHGVALVRSSSRAGSSGRSSSQDTASRARRAGSWSRGGECPMSSPCKPKSTEKTGTGVVAL